MVSEKSVKNLRSFADLPVEVRKASGSKGGLVAAESRKRRKMLKEIVQMVLEHKPAPNISESISKIFPDIPKEEVTNRLALIAVVYQKALSGDLKAFEIIRDTGGEKPGERMDISNTDGTFSPKRLEVVFKRSIGHE